VFDLVVGSAAATTGDNSGLVIVNNATGKGWLGFNDANSASIPGQVTYDHATDTLALVSAGSTIASITSTGLAVTGATVAGFSTPITATNPSTNGASAAKIAFNGGGTIWGEVGASYNSNDPYMAFFVRSGSEKMRITDAGNVGIGTTSPAARLHILGAGVSAPILQLTTTGTGNREFRHVISGAGADYDTLFIQGNTASGGTTFATLLAIKASGNVGIGTDNPGSKLDVNGELRIGNTVAAAVAVASTHKVTIVIGGVTYYLLATNV
jgi:hypothetical protein